MKKAKWDELAYWEIYCFVELGMKICT